MTQAIPLPYSSASYVVTQGFDTTPSHNDYLKWGVDFAMPYGTDVRAMISGEIVAFRQDVVETTILGPADGDNLAFSGSGHGNFITVRSVIDGQDLFITYAHLAPNFLSDSLGIQESEGAYDLGTVWGSIDFGQIFAQTGATGLRGTSRPESDGAERGAHLHVHLGTDIVFFNTDAEWVADGSSDTTLPVFFDAFGKNDLDVPLGPMEFGPPYLGADYSIYNDAHLFVEDSNSTLSLIQTFQLNDTIVGPQWYADMLPLSEGNFLVVWRTRESSQGTVARLIDQDGPVGEEFTVSDRASDFSLLELGSGEVILINTDSSFFRPTVYVHTIEIDEISGQISTEQLAVRIDEDGTKGIDQVTANYRAAVATQDGGFVLVIEESNTTNNDFVFMAFNDQKELVVELQLDLHVNEAADIQNELSVRVIQNGNILLFWGEAEGDPFDHDPVRYYIQQLSPQGNILGDPLLVTDQGSRFATGVKIVELLDGKFFASWVEYDTVTLQYSIVGKLFQNDGTSYPTTGELRIEHTFASRYSVAPAEDGVLIVFLDRDEELQTVQKAIHFSSTGQATELLGGFVTDIVHRTDIIRLETGEYVISGEFRRTEANDGEDVFDLTEVGVSIINVSDSLPTNSPPSVDATTITGAALLGLDPVPLNALFTFADPDGLEDIVEIRISDDTPGNDGGEFGRIVVSNLQGTSGTLWEPLQRIDGEQYRLTLTPDQLNEEVGPFGEFVWNYRPSNEGSNSIQVEAVDSAGNVSDPLIINLTFTDGEVLPSEAPVIVDPGLITVQEGAMGVIHDLVATDDKDTEGEGGGLIFTRAPSSDQLNLSVDLYSGEITFRRDIDGNIVEDANGDGVYELSVTLTDSDGFTDSLDLAIEVIPNNPIEEIVFEYFSRVVAYGRDNGQLSILEEPPRADIPEELQGWEREYLFENESGSFKAETFTKAGYAPLLVFRGTVSDGDATDIVNDWAENFRSTGVGIEEFNRSVNLPGEIAGDLVGDAPTLGEWLLSQGSPISITGHSQGGAQAQIAAFAAASNGREVAQVVTYNSAGTTLGFSKAVEELSELFATTDVTHHINVSDVVSLTGNMFIPSGTENSISLHDTSVPVLETPVGAFPNLIAAHTGYWVSDELRDLLTADSQPAVEVSELASPPSLQGFVSPTYSPNAGPFGQDADYQDFLDALTFFGNTVGRVINIAADRLGVGTLTIESSSLTTPIASLNIGDLNFRDFVVNDFVPALSSRGRLAEELGGENGDLIRELLSSATLYFNELERGAQITVEGSVAGIIPVSYEIQPGSTEDELHSMSPGQPVVLSGRPEDLFGDRATDFREEDTLVIADTAVTPEMFDWYLSSAVLTFDLDLDGEIDGEIILEGDYFEGAEFNLEIIGNDTHITVDLNQAPIASDDGGVDFGTTDSTAFTTGNVLLNDTDGDNDELSVVGLDDAGTLGLVTDNGDGTFDYDPNGAFDSLLDGETATDSFVYLVSDGTETVSSEVTITVAGEGALDPVRNLINGTSGADYIAGTDQADDINAMSGDDTVAPRAGDDIISLGTGANKLIGSASDHFGDTIRDFSVDDRIIFEGAEFARSDVTVRGDPTVLAIDLDQDGGVDGSMTLLGDLSSGDFMAVAYDGNTDVTFETFLPALQEGRALDPNLVNGIINQNFLKGDGSSDFQVTLRDMGFAGYDNTIGVYEIDASGNIIDTRILFENANADKSAIAGITDVEAGNRLGFFIVQDAADWATTLAAGDTLSFVDSSGAVANISDGSDISIAVNGFAVDEIVFHSFSKDMNVDGVQHALSGVDVGGQSISVGFEDLTGGGDLDYEDVVFRVEIVDDFMFI